VDGIFAEADISLAGVASTAVSKDETVDRLLLCRAVVGARILNPFPNPVGVFCAMIEA
jgi:hypothetical protein